MKTPYALFAAALTLCLSACVTTRVTRLAPLDPGTLQPGKQTITVLGYHLEGWTAADGTCSLEVEDRDHHSRYSFALEADKQALYLELPLGTFIAKQLYCPDLSIRWDLDGLWSGGVEPVDGKINYAGFFKAILSKSAGGDPQLKTQSSDRALSSDEARRLLSTSPSSWAPHWVSISTGRPLRKSMVQNTDKTYGLKFKTEVFSKEEGLSSTALQAAVQTCETLERSKNFLLIGNLAYYAKYEGGHLAEFRKDAEEEAFHEDFPRCIESALRSHAPAFAAKMEFWVSY